MSDVKREPPQRPRTLRAERAAATRQRILDSARMLFGRDGYGATTLKGIAADAGVAVQTVYAVFGSKPGILAALREVALNQPAAEASIREAMREPAAARRLELFTRSVRQRWEFAGDIVAIHRDAGASDAAVREEVDEVLRIRRGGIEGFARSLASQVRGDLDAESVAAVLDALTMPELYAELVEVHRWSPDRYESWLSAVLSRELLDG